jgi:hypothetical protein
MPLWHKRRRKTGQLGFRLSLAPTNNTDFRIAKAKRCKSQVASFKRENGGFHKKTPPCLQLIACNSQLELLTLRQEENKKPFGALLLNGFFCAKI